MQPWKAVSTPDDIDIVSPEGTVRCRVKGYYGGSMFTIDDMNVDVRPGDEIRRMLPNGKEETFTVEDPKFFKGPAFGPHYQVSVSRRGTFDRHTGGNYSINIHGQNSRVNIGSHDNSINIANTGNVVAKIRDALKSAHTEDRGKLESALAKIENAKDRESFLSAYQELIASARDHMAILAPFLPALGNILNGLT